MICLLWDYYEAQSKWKNWPTLNAAGQKQKYFYMLFFFGPSREQKVIKYILFVLYFDFWKTLILTTPKSTPY